MKALGKRIHDKREECKFTQSQLAEKIGVSRQTIYKWENGSVKHIDREYIASLANVLNCTPDWLMGMDGTDVILTYQAEGREPVQLRVNGKPIIGEVSLRAKLYDAALKVRPENLQIAIGLLQSLA